MKRGTKFGTFFCLALLSLIPSPLLAAGLPAGWAGADVNSEEGQGGQLHDAPGSVSFDGATWTLTATGRDISNVIDEFYYAYQYPCSGDVTITARVVSMKGGDSTWAKAGVMLRQNIGPAGGVSYVMVAATPGKGTTLQNRPPNNTAWTLVAGLAPPTWVRLQRTGKTITGYTARDGATWTAMPGTSTDGTPVPGATIPAALTDPCYIGLVCCAHEPHNVCTAVFDNVTITSGAVTPPANTGPTGPTVTTQPVNITVNAGQTATFGVKATGTGTLSYQWLMNGANIEGATSAAYSTANAANGLTFACIVTDNKGSSTSNTATLTVNSGPPKPPR